MKKILISFIGNNDCFLSEGKEGAILSILKERQFDFLYILYNDDRYLKYASEILKYCRKKYKSLTVRYQEAKTLNPIDYNLVYPAMVSAINSITKKKGIKDVEYTISLTSGTPTMHTCWVLIVQGGIIDAKLIQVSREEGITEIDFDIDDFPQITTENQLKAELTKKSRENVILRQQILSDFSELIGEDNSIIKIKQQINNLVNYDIPVFISGESGTGKEVVASLLHYKSPRKEHPFITVNCGSISEKLFESEFFGHKKGSFTGAIDNHEGYFSQADKGTLFLDEIADLPLPMQVKLFRALETNKIMPVGGKEKKVDVRIITASNKDIQNMIIDESFRKELYYRIVQAEIKLPPLRERNMDIILLAKHFLASVCRKHSNTKTLTSDAEEKLLSYSYPGNVRELKNIINVAYINSITDKITADDITFREIKQKSSPILIPPEGIDLDNEIIPAYYQAALKITKNNKAKAARLLKLAPHTFRARLKKFENTFNDKK